MGRDYLPYCRNCGAIVQTTDTNCRNCGAPQTAQASPPPPPAPAYYYHPYQQVEVHHEGPWNAIGWVILIILLVVILVPLAFFVCLGYSCAQISIAVPLGLYLWKRWMVGRAGI